ncbi:MAG: UDP-N-acetylmuramoyl-L-alanyl-D-glutamate--2,6-diaminopimelate ligase [Eubacteriales bacterium]|nr:UDP-N-acetylmuramoyl-L-alanyl-D-glutamate--2,6-diaminopimelate ligase [Eubacteriales bacterium]
MNKLIEWMDGTDLKCLKGSAEVNVDEVIYDSRKARENAVFVCMMGSRIDSHTFIKDCYEKGVRTFVVEKELGELELPEGEINIFKTEDVRNTLALLSAARFGHPFEKLTSIAITGTKGKTTSSTMLKSVLEACGKKTGLIGTNGCFIDGVRTPTVNTTPESYELHEDFRKMVDAGCEYVVMEVSSQAVKMKRTAGMMFDYGIFLNISPDHIGPNEHESFEEYMDCKAGVLRQCKKVIINADARHSDEVLKLSGKKEAYRFSVNEALDECARDIEYVMDTDFTGTYFKAEGVMNGFMRLPLPGYFNIENALSVILVSGLLGLPADLTEKGIESTSVNGRMEVVARTDKYTIFVDYAHNEVSMVSLLKTLRENYNPERLVIVFGCGGNRSKDRRTGMGAAAAHSADFSIFTSDNSRYEKPEDIIADIKEAYLNAGGKEENCACIVSRRDAIRYSMEHAKKGDMIAIIGKGHEDYQEENGVRTHFLDKEVILEEKEKLEA